jgi:formylglycine-generating enzyme required for sulfatase activity
MKPQLSKLLTDFEAWQNGQALSEVRLVQHELVLAHLARLYGGLAWNAQHFGLCPSYPLVVEIQQDRPVALSELLAVTATGKLLVCAEAEIPESENPIENNGLFAIARPLPLPETQQETLPDFPFYQVQLEWRAWQAGIDELVKPGEGLPLGRFRNGQWDTDYSPPVMSLATDQRLSQQATELMSRVDQLASRESQLADLVVPLRQTDWTVETPWAFWQAHYRCLMALKDHPKLAEDSAFHAKVSELVLFECSEMAASLVLLGSIWETIEQRFDKESARQKSLAQLMSRVNKLASRDSRLADLVVPLRQTDWTTETPRAFWQAHCRCLVALKDHPKLVEDRDYQDCVSTLLSASFSLSMFGDGLEPLRFAWQRVEQGLEKPAKRPARYVSLGWYATSLVALVFVAGLLGMDLVYQYNNSINDLKAELAALDNKHSERLIVLDNKQAETLQALRTELAAVGNEHDKKAAKLSKQLTALDNKQAQTAADLSKKLTVLGDKQALTAADLSNNLTAVDNEHDEKAAKLSKQLTALDNKQAQTAAELSKKLTVLGDKQALTADKLSNNLTAVDNEHDEKAAKLSKQLTALDNKQAQTAADLSKKLTVLDNKQAQTVDNLSNKLTVLDNKQAETAAELSKRLTVLDNKQALTAADLSKRLTVLDNKQAQTVDNLSNKLTVLDNKQAETAAELSKRVTMLGDKQAQTADNLSKRITALETKHVQKAGKTDWTPGKILRDRLKDGTLGPEMVVIPAGTFRMGDIQGGGDSNEQPVHEVSVKRFAMGRYEVTVAEFRKFVNATGYKTDAEKGGNCWSYAKGWKNLKGANWRNSGGFSQTENHPVVCVSWNDATAYAKWLTKKTGHHYRLPTEAEWEYSARAGTETKYWWGNDIGKNRANCDGNYCGDNFEYTARVGSFAANPFGLFDTVGNVWEWSCSEYQDKYSGKEQRCANSGSLWALRGGAWDFGPRFVRAAFRSRRSRDFRYGLVGLRLARQF